MSLISDGGGSPGHDGPNVRQPNVGYDRNQPNDRVPNAHYYAYEQQVDQVQSRDREPDATSEPETHG
jgi:hypothetical protein